LKHRKNETRKPKKAENENAPCLPNSDSEWTNTGRPRVQRLLPHCRASTDISATAGLYHARQLNPFMTPFPPVTTAQIDPPKATRAGVTSG
jgi:hypothetical protein